MRWMCHAILAMILCSCSAAPTRMTETCRPTGWVDRVEGQWVIIDPDQQDAETLVLSTSCFSGPVRGGQRIVDGQVDHGETEAMRRTIAEIASRLVRVTDEPN